MKRRTLLVLTIAVAATAVSWPARAQNLELDAPVVALRGIPFDVVVAGEVADAGSLLLRAGAGAFAAEALEDGGYVVAGVVVPGSGVAELELVVSGTVVAETSVRVIPGWIAILRR